MSIRAVLAPFLVTAIAGWAALPSRPAGAQQLSGSGDRLETAAQQEIATLVATPGAIHADALDERVRALVAAGRAAEPEVRVFAERALALRRGAGDPPALLASSLALLGEVLLAAGELDPAADAMVEAEELLFPLADGERQLARVRCRLAVVRRAQGDTVEAARLAASGLAALESDASAGDPDVSQCATELAEIATAMGDYRTAWRTYEKLLDDQLAVFGTASLQAGIARRMTAQAASDAGEYETAETLFRQAQTTLEASLGPAHLEVAAVLNGLANVARRRGDYVEARRLLEESLAILEDAVGPDDPRVAAAFTSLGNVQVGLGDFPAAQLTYKRALAIWERISGPEDPKVARILSNLGAVMLSRGDPEGAIPLLERSVAIRERAFGTDAPILGVPLSNLGDAYLQAGDLDRARATLERAAAIYEQDRGDKTNATEAVNNLGLLMLEQGDGAEAAAAFGRARRIVEETAGHDHPRTAIVIANQARAAAFQELPDAAVGFALESERIAREHLRLTAAGLSEREALAYAVQQRESLDLVLSLITEFSVDDPTLLAAAWDTLIRSRGLVLEEMTLRRAMLGSYPEAADAVEAWRSAAGRLSQALVDGRAEGGGEGIVQARRELERAERALGGLVPTFDLELARSGCGYEEVAAGLPGESCLVAYSRFDRTWNRDSERWDDGPFFWYLAFVRTPEGEIAALPLEDAATIDQAVARWRAEVATPRRGDRAVAAAGERLRRAVWDPVSERCAGARRLFVIPGGELALVNLAALPAGPGTFVIETTPPIAVLEHERDVVETPTEQQSGPCLLAVGGPDFDAAGAHARERGSVAVTAASAPFSPLPGSAAEAAAAVELWTGLQPENSAVRLTGAEATEAAFKAFAPDFRFIHLATHGFFRDDAGSPSTGGGRGVGGLVSEEAATNAEHSGLPPLVGLAFAGANRAESGSEDGILTAEEIATLDLGGVEWAVLSACESGVGEVASHEGVFGLQRAFSVAGVQTVVMSLWGVDDEATREWMTSFYHFRLGDGLPTADAVRAADLEILAARRARGDSLHPAHWAAFQATGDWR